MKKFLSVLLSVCLVFTLCISSFAANIRVPSSVTDKIQTAVDSLNPSSTKEEVTAVAQEIIAAIQETGASTKTEIIQVADQLYVDGVITEDLYNEIYLIVQSDSFNPADNQTSNIMDQITAIIEDSSKTTEEKIAAIAPILLSLPASQAQSILDKLYEQGVLDDNMYNKISDVLNSEITLPSIGGGDTPSIGGGDGGSAIQGIIDTVMGLLGLGGGDNGGDSNDGNSDSGNNNSSSFEGDNAKTGDYAIPAVAAVALAAGVVLVLTKKKK